MSQDPKPKPDDARRNVRIHAVESLVDADVLAPFQAKLDQLAHTCPEIVEHISNMMKAGRGA